MRIKLGVLTLSLSALLAFPQLAQSAGEKIVIVGTGDGVSVLKSIGDSFTQANPGVTVDVPKSIGSGGGIKAVGADKYVIGRVARGIKDKEKPYGLSYAPFAKIPVVFFVNKGVGLKGLSAEQVAGIYTGKITNWKAVGGKDSKIRVVRREDGDSSLKVLRKSFPGFKDIDITAKSKTATNTGENISTVASISGAIGFGPYPDAVAADVDVMKIGGKSATDAAYPSFGTVALIFKDANKKGDIGKFISFATSSAAHDSIKAANGLPN